MRLLKAKNIIPSLKFKASSSTYATFLVLDGDLHIKSWRFQLLRFVAKAITSSRCENSCHSESQIFSCGATRRVRFRGLISGREIVNTLKSRTARTLLTISPQFASNDPVFHLTLILLNLARELFERGLAVEMEGEDEDGVLERASESKIDAPRDAEEISSRPAINSS